MTNANKRKGTAYEVDVRNTLREEGLDVERLVLNGQKDEGDLVVTVGASKYILEAKNRQQIDLAQYTREAVAEADNYADNRPAIDRAHVTGVAVVKRRGASVLDSYVVTTLREFFKVGQE